MWKNEENSFTLVMTFLKEFLQERVLFNYISFISFLFFLLYWNAFETASIKTIESFLLILAKLQ